MENHNAQSIIVTCIDFRIQEYINKWISKHFPPRTFDRVALAGGEKDLETVMEQIDIAVRLHHVKKAVLINHEDCGAYGSKDYVDHHARDLRLASNTIKAHFPDLKVETYYLHLDGTFEPIA